MSTIAPEERKTDLGAIEIAPEVVGTIAGMAALEVDGVAGMSGDFAGGIAELLGRKSLTKGVKVFVSEHETSADVSIIVRYGVRIPEVAGEVQRNVRNAITSMTGLTVTSVNVFVHGVHLPTEPRQAEVAEPLRVK